MDYYGLARKFGHFAAVAADVAKWYNAASAVADPVPSTQQLVIYGWHGFVSVAEATKFAIFSDEDGTQVFGGIGLDTAENFHVILANPIRLAAGKDIKVDVTMTSGRFSIDFDTGYITL